MSRFHASIPTSLAAICLVAVVGTGFAQESTPLIHYGGMHETLAKGQHQARVHMGELDDHEHLYAIGALEGLAGEVTILDSVVFATTVTPQGQPRPLDGERVAATMLVGQSVARWTTLPIPEGVTPERFDDVIRNSAIAHDIDPATPFMFVVEGTFTDVRLHVLHGACPVHARINKLELAAEQRPYELEIATLRGTMVGVYAADAVGKLTHPATSTHAHLVYVDDVTGERITGHLERVGVGPGATLRIPDVAAPKSDEPEHER